MMTNNILFWLLICGHLLGDFYFQTPEMAKGKKKSSVIFLKHCLIYALAMLLALLPVIDGHILMVWFAVSVSHGIIDFLKITVENLATKKTPVLCFFQSNLFVLDQLLHVIIILLASVIARDIISLNLLGEYLRSFYSMLEIQLLPLAFIKGLFIILVIGKPANIIIQEINRKEKIESHSDTDVKTDREYKNAGKIIGILERIIIVMMIMLKQYAAIALILTAKSITRYKKIENEPAFAEYYLVGTLLSLIISVVAVLAVS